MKRRRLLHLTVLLLGAFAGPIPARATEEAVQALALVDGAAFDETYLRFLNTHLEHGSDLAALGVMRGSSDRVRTIATELRAAQESELREIQALQRIAALDTDAAPPAAPTAPTTGITDSEVLAAGGLPFAPSGLTLTLTAAEPEPEPAQPIPSETSEALPSHVEHAVTRAQNAAAREVLERLEGVEDGVFDETFAREMIARLSVGKRMADTGRLRGSTEEVHALATRISQRQQAFLDRLRELVSDT